MNSNNKENEEHSVREEIDKLIKRFRRSVQLLNSKREKKIDVYEDHYDKGNLVESIRLARAEWIDASRNFEFAYDKEIIDYYTYQIKASETRYQYLLKLARERSIKLGTKDNIKYIVQGRTISG